jgi:hypothetical protein
MRIPNFDNLQIIGQEHGQRSNPSTDTNLDDSPVRGDERILLPRDRRTQGSELPMSVPLGIGLALILGKPLGICLTALLAAKFGISRLPEGITWRGVLLIRCLGGIGFTLSVFIANLAFADEAFLASAKLAILIGLGGLRDRGPDRRPAYAAPAGSGGRHGLIRASVRLQSTRRTGWTLRSLTLPARHNDTQQKVR